MGGQYGIPYMGSKSRIAEAIINFLPLGNRLVDLFGGGGAITECGMLWKVKGVKKYKKFLYNEYNPLIYNLIKDAIKGKYSYNNGFRPKFITREEFERLKDTDGYIQCIWSFGNNQKGYMFGRDREHIKEIGHNLVIFNTQSEELEKLCPGVCRYVDKDKDLYKRRLRYTEYINKVYRNIDRHKGELEQLECIERLEHLERLERLQQLILTNKSYDEYEYIDGDIVYCDPPYENTAEYKISFDSKRFYDWVDSRPYQVFFSTYKINDDRFKLVFAKQLRSILSIKTNIKENENKFECIYTQKRYANK